MGQTDNELYWEHQHGHWMASDRLRTESSHAYIWKNRGGILKKYAGYLLDGNYTKLFQEYTF
jgi:hypothetical protein